MTSLYKKYQIRQNLKKGVPFGHAFVYMEVKWHWAFKSWCARHGWTMCGRIEYLMKEILYGRMPFPSGAKKCRRFVYRKDKCNTALLLNFHKKVYNVFMDLCHEHHASFSSTAEQLIKWQCRKDFDKLGTGLLWKEPMGRDPDETKNQNI